jgi:hypothetical protein
MESRPPHMSGRIIKKPHPALISPMRPLETLTSTLIELATERH